MPRSAAPFRHESTAVSSVLAELVDLVWPRSCAGCDAWGRCWCEECARNVSPPARVRPGLAPHLVVHSAARFEGSLRRAVTAFKDEGRSDIAPVLGRLLASSITSAIAEYETSGTAPATWSVVPVPSSRAATRRRGRFPLGELVRSARWWMARESSDAVAEAPLLRSVRQTADQSRLGRDARRANVIDAFATDPRVLRRTSRETGIVLVDDVVTSGATLASAHGALCEVGLDSIVIATVAATPHTGAPPHPDGRSRPESEPARFSLFESLVRASRRD